jgi:hypothetical protein
MITLKDGRTFEHAELSEKGVALYKTRLAPDPVFIPLLNYNSLWKSGVINPSRVNSIPISD